MVLTQEQAARLKAGNQKRADEIDERLARDRKIAKETRTSNKKCRSGKQKSVRTVRG